MSTIRRLILAALLALSLAPAFGQSAPPPVPALPDTERRTSYSISATTCACAVNFALYGDSTDVDAWIEVWINGKQYLSTDPIFGWSLSSATGPFATIPRPITDAVLSFNTAQTGTVQIVGARRPRRLSQFAENRGVAARDLNQIITDIVAQNRETWDRTNDVTGRAVLAPAGETLAILPALASRRNFGACFDNNGNLTTCVALPSTTITAGNGIVFTGTNPTTISANLQAGAGISITGTNPLTIAASGANGTNIQGGNYTIATSDCGKTVSETGALQTLTLPSVSGFTEGCLVTLFNGSTSRGQKLSGFPDGNQGCSLGQGILWPSGSCAVQVINGAWRTQRPQRRWKTPSALTLFSNNGGSNSADCLVTGVLGACNTAQHAIYVACNEFDFTGLDAGQTVLTIQLDNNDTNGIHYSCRAQMGAQGGAPILIQGANPTVVMSGVSTDALGVFTNAVVQIRSLTLATTGAGSCITADLHAQIYVLDAMTFNACTSAHMNASNNSDIYLNNNYAVLGSAQFHFLAQNGAHITTQATLAATLGANVTVTAWATAGQQGGILVPNWGLNLNSFTVTGTRSASSNQALIYTGVGKTACLTTYFPGTVNGTDNSTTNGGWCL